MFLHYKKRFQTCLQMLGDVREQFPDLQDQIMSYAGVLDPMAEGWVPVLVGKTENQDRVRHTQSVKEYVVQILVGVGTDSGDLMGILQEQNNQITIHNIQEITNNQNKINKIKYEIENFPETYLQKISKFANKKYKSKPLWWYQLNEVDLPEEALVEREVRILDREVMGVGDVTREVLADEIGAMMEVFGTTFRMERIVPSWDEWLRNVPEGASLSLVEVRVVVSKGFFVRQWVQDLAKAVGVPLTVYSLKRTKVIE